MKQTIEWTIVINKINLFVILLFNTLLIVTLLVSGYIICIAY